MEIPQKAPPARPQREVIKFVERIIEVNKPQPERIPAPPPLENLQYRDQYINVDPQEYKDRRICKKCQNKFGNIQLDARRVLEPGVVHEEGSNMNWQNNMWFEDWHKNGVVQDHVSQGNVAVSSPYAHGAGPFGLQATAKGNDNFSMSRVANNIVYPKDWNSVTDIDKISSLSRRGLATPRMWQGAEYGYFGENHRIVASPSGITPGYISEGRHVSMSPSKINPGQILSQGISQDPREMLANYFVSKKLEEKKTATKKIVQKNLNKTGRVKDTKK